MLRSTPSVRSDKQNASIELTEQPQDGPSREPSLPDDGQDMKALGRPQQLHRQFKTRSLVGFTVTLGATWPYAIVSTPISLANGGPAGAIWMFILTAIGFGAVVTSLAHAASMQPYSGGPYHWVSVFARKRHQKLLSYTVGWLEVIGWIAGTAATAYFVGEIFLSQIALFHPKYVIQPWQYTVACIGVTFLAVVVNYFIKAFRLLEGLILFFNIGAFLCYLVVLLALGPQKDVAKTFFDIQDTQGWGSKGTAALVGLLGPIITLIGADSTSHLAEETVGARKIVPQAMFISVAISYSFGFIMTVVIMVVSTGYSQDVATQTGNAGIAIILNATRSLPATQAMTIILFLLLFWGLTNQVTGASRITWAFARDGGLPGYTWLAKVNSVNVPNGAILLTFACTVLLALFPLASTISLNIVTSFQMASMSLAYLITVSVLLDSRFRKDIPEVDMDDRHFPLPRWTATVANIIALMFLSVATVFLCFPAAPNPTASSMNWTCVLLPTIVGYAFLHYYFLGGRTKYEGPVSKLRLFR